MKKISLESTVEFLNRKKENNIMNIDNLKYMQEEGGSVECYRNLDCVYVFEKVNEDVYGYIFSIGNRIKTDDIITLLEKYTNMVSLNIDVQEFDEDSVKVIKAILENSRLELKRELKDYCMNSNCVVLKDNCENTNTRILTGADKEAFVSMENEVESGRPPLEILYKVFIMQKRGNIIAYFDENKIVGYISFNMLFDNIFDVDYIYVSPSQRKNGIGKKLAIAFVNEVLSKNGVAFWSNAKTLESERIAEKVGFKLARKSLIYKF